MPLYVDLDATLLQLLQTNQTSQTLPMTLQTNQTLNPAMPTDGFDATNHHGNIGSTWRIVLSCVR